MGHYSDKSTSVRVDFFKASGKWYCTEAVEPGARVWWIRATTAPGSLMVESR
jgi:hypothetical protein